MKSKMLKRAFAVGLSAAMLMSMTIGASAASVSYDVPQKPMTVDKNLVTCAAHAQADASPEIIGLTNTTDRAGEVPNNYDLKKAQSSTLIGTFGTDINAAPNPYLYNWAYNSWASANNRTLADKHTLGGISGHPNSVDTEVVPELGTVRSLYYRPDILVGTSGGDYSSLVADLPENRDGSNSYNPYVVNYKMNVCSDFLSSLYDMAYDSQAVMKADSSKHMRYGDPVAIADKLTNYTVGLQSYILQQLARNNAPKKKVAIIDTSTSQNGVFNCVSASVSTQQTTSHARVGEFLDATTDNIVNTLGKTPEKVGDGRRSKMAYSLTAKEIVENADIIVTGGVNVGSNMSADAVRELLLPYLNNDANLSNKLKSMPVMSSSFDTVGSIGANSIENLLGMAYWSGFCYPEYVNPVYAATYWYYNFYHVTDNSKLANIIDSTMAQASKPGNVSTDISGYSESDMQKKIDAGMAYYRTGAVNNKELADMAANLNHSNKTTDKASKGGSTKSASDFTDVAQNSWYYNAVNYGVKNNLISGTTPTTFSPDSNITRGQFAFILYRAFNRPVVTSSSPFTDVQRSDYYGDAVIWAYNNDIVNGTSPTTYSPTNDITREQMAVLFYNAAKYSKKNTSATNNLSSFPDASKIDSYAREAMQWAVGSGLMQGMDGQLNPLGTATRAQAAQMFMQYGNLK